MGDSPSVRATPGTTRSGGRGRELRILDFGTVSPLRSQTLWHALAWGVSQGGPASLSFLRPGAPYVSLGYHRRLEELDLVRCRALDLPIYRRMVGGGAVYLDPEQLFFQLAVPAGGLPALRARALERLLEPALAGFAAIGLPAELDHHGEVVVGDRKVCGHGAGQIGAAVVVVGNCVTHFDHETATSVLRLEGSDLRSEVLGAMRRYVGTESPAGMPGDPSDDHRFVAAAVASYAAALSLVPVEGRLRAAERRQLGVFDRRLSDAGWTAGPALSSRRPLGEGVAGPATRTVKIRGGVHVLGVSYAGASVTLRVVEGVVQTARIAGTAPEAFCRVVEGLRGGRLADAPRRLERAGSLGSSLVRSITAAAQAVGEEA